MIDIQKTSDNHHHIEIKKVGVKNLKYPIIIKTKENQNQNTIGIFSLYTSLISSQKGTHMSRFVSILNKYKNQPIEIDTMKLIVKEISENIDNQISNIVCEFPYFIEKEAPVSKQKGLIDYNTTFDCTYYPKSETYDFIIKVTVPITSLCPCSKSISENGAHNQRSSVSVTIFQQNEIFWIEDIIDIVEQNSSCQVYSVLKRVDEKYVTEKAYNNPMFCEDIVRNISYELMNKYSNLKFIVETLNYESIHNHDAYAMISNC